MHRVLACNMSAITINPIPPLPSPFLPEVHPPPTTLLGVLHSVAAKAVKSMVIIGFSSWLSNAKCKSNDAFITFLAFCKLTTKLASASNASSENFLHQDKPTRLVVV